MNSLIPFPPARDASLPPARRTLNRVFSELAGLESEDARLAGFAAKLQTDIAKATEVESQYDEAISADASLLISRLREGLEGIWGSVGGRSRRAGDAAIAAHSDKLVGERALAAVIAEREKIQRRVEELNQEKQVAIDSVTIEAIGAGLKAELTESLEAARIALTRLEALHSAVNPPSAEYKPNHRAAITIDASRADDVELVIETREVAKSLSVIEAFKTALQHDPLAAAPIFPDLDRSIDPSVIYHELRLSERPVRDADPSFAPRIAHKAQTAV